MTDEQINAAIAEACGWRQSERNIAHWNHVSEPYSHILFRDLPNYCTDLNAMHEAEKVLIKGFEEDPESSELWSDYQTNLIIACPAYLSYHATARQRAEAFLRTLGKWKEATDKESLTVQPTALSDHIGDRTEMIRSQAAIAAMQGHIVHRGFSENAKHTAELAVRYADALIVELQREVQP